MDGYWSAAAAGHVEPGESAAAAAVREASEELGVLIEPTDLRLLTVSARHQNHDGSAKTYEDHFFVARNWSGTPVIREPQRAAELRFWDREATFNDSPARIDSTGSARRQ